MVLQVPHGMQLHDIWVYFYSVWGKQPSFALHNSIPGAETFGWHDIHSVPIQQAS
jgi:hypothetical protein